jgi:GST-like protein
VDKDNGISVFESGTILMYLADKVSRFYPQDFVKRIKVNEWLMWQMGNFGPMLGRAHSFLHYNPGKAPFAEEWFAKEAKRLYGVLNTQLEKFEFMVGDYSIADIATFPWAARHQWQRIDLNDYPHVKRWYLAIAERPSVQKGFPVPGGTSTIPMPA